MFHWSALSQGVEDGSKFFPLSKSVMVPTLDFDSSGILLGVGSVPPTEDQSTFGVFLAGFHL